VKPCEEFIRNRDITISEFLTVCDICVHDSKFGCKVKGANYETSIVHKPIRGNSRVRLFR
jgi:hypothetical protein